MSAMPLSFPVFKAFTQTGTLGPLVGGKLYSFAAGTSTPLVTYADAALTTPNANPVVLDANGEALVYLGAASYKLRLENSASVVQAGWPIDNIQSSAAISALYTDALRTDLASTSDVAKGDALIGVKQPFTGSTPRTQHDKNADQLSPEDFGAVGDGITNDTAAMQAWATSGGTLVGSPKTFKVAGSIVFPVGITLDGRGMVIDGSAAGGTWSTSAVCSVTGSLSALPAITSSVVAGGYSMTFASAHGLLPNDVGIVYDPTDGSWLASRTYYRAGEFFRPVAASALDNTIRLWNPLYAGYDKAVVTLHKLATNAVSISNLVVKAPSSGSIRPLKISLATKVRLSAVGCSGSDYVGVDLDRCYDVEISAGIATVNPVAYGDEYGISIGNSHSVRIIGGEYYASRHAIAIGGDDFTGSVPNRDIWIMGAKLSNDINSSAPTCDVHGNCQDIHYVNCDVHGGGSFGGKDVFYDGCAFWGAPVGIGALIAGGSESLGGVYSVRNCYLKGTAAYAVGLVRGFMGAESGDATLIVENCSVDAGAADTLVRFDFDASATTAKANAIIRNITINSGGGLTNICRMVGTGDVTPGEGGDGNFVVVDGITNAPVGCSLYVATSEYGDTVKCKLQRQTGTVVVTPVSAANIAGASAVFRYSYGSKTPNVTLCQSTSEVNAKTIGNRYGGLSATGLTGYIWTTDRANFGATTPDVTLQWTAGLDEI